ncbi:maltose acetyltransferase domain-containing protein [Micromonospora thermarum]|nr:maltose acetyltransferase domain-containing protein [Micromonospora thermarum]
MKERMLAGEPYIADEPEILADLDRAARLMERFNSSSASDPDGRLAALRDLLGGLGEDTVVGAGAVVTRDLPPNVVAVGNPARVVRELA